MVLNGSSDDAYRGATSFEGVSYDPDAELWVLRDTVSEFTFDWVRVSEQVSPQVLRSIKETLRWYVEHRSLSRTRNIYMGLNHILGTLGFSLQSQLTLLTESALIRYRNSLGKRNEWRLGTLRRFLLKWYERGLPGIDDSAALWLNEVKLAGNTKGEAVATQDPQSGPFTQMEALAVHQSAIVAFGLGQISIGDFCLVQLVSALGSRSVQFAALKCKDLLPPQDSTAGDWTLLVPRAKQRLGRARSELKPRTLIPHLAQIVSAQVEETQKTYRASGHSSIALEELPIFPNWHASGFPGFEFHSTSLELGHRTIAIARQLNVRSERNGSRLAITSRRFRYTVGTRAAEEGHGELVIAELLDHSDIQQVAVYVRATEKIADRISKAVALRMAPLAQAFMGMLIDSESSATRSADPKSRIRSPQSLDALGNCGQLGFCSEAAPVACYTCRRFQAWVDGPHEQLLDTLLVERERSMKTTGDPRIASVNDRTILAIANVVQLCKKRLTPRLQ